MRTPRALVAAAFLFLAACGGEEAQVDGETAASPTIDSAAAAVTPAADTVTDTTGTPP
jgi:hypothetical protein